MKIQLATMHHLNSKLFTMEFLDRNKDVLVISSTGDEIDHKNASRVIYPEHIPTPFTLSFNLALKNIGDADYIMVCNNDISLNHDTFKNIVTQIETHTKLTGKPGIYSPSFNSPHAGVMSPKTDRPIRLVPWLEFIAPIIPKEAIKKVGLLDESMPHGWGIELDYCYRASDKNIKSYLLQRLPVFHYEHKSQKNHQDYINIASPEMHTMLEKKYGESWQSVLSFPQWN